MRTVVFIGQGYPGWLHTPIRHACCLNPHDLQMDGSPLVRKTMAKFLGESAQADSRPATLQHASQVLQPARSSSGLRAFAWTHDIMSSGRPWMCA